MSKGFDVASIDLEKAAEEGADCNLVHPVSGDDLGIVIRVLGLDSKAYRKARRDMVKAMSKARKSEGGDAERKIAEATAAVTVSWSGLVWEGKDLPFSKENAVMVYTKRPWILDQVESFATDRANFFTG